MFKHEFKVGDKIEARRNNGNLIQAEIDALFENKASVFWYGENQVLLTRKFYYREIIKVNSNNNQISAVNMVNVHYNQQLNFGKRAYNSCLQNALTIIGLCLFVTFLLFVFLIFIFGVFETYENSYKVIFH